MENFPLLVPAFDNHYYKQSVELIEQFGGARVVRFQPGKVYRLRQVVMTQSNNRFFPQTSSAIVASRIIPNIMANFSGMPYYEKLAIIKLEGSNMHASSQHRSHKHGENFKSLLTRHNITLIDTSSLSEGEILYCSL